MWAWSLLFLGLAGQLTSGQTSSADQALPNDAKSPAVSAVANPPTGLASATLPSDSSAAGSASSALSASPGIDSPGGAGAESSAGSTADLQPPSNIGSQNLINIGVGVGVFVLSVLLAGPLASALRMPGDSTRFAIVLFSVFAGTAVCVLGWPPKRGVDLAGGTILVYETQADTDEGKGAGQGKEQINSDGAGRIDMDKLTAAIRRRIDPAGVKELLIRRRGVREIEIVMPKVEAAEVEEIKRRISKIGALEFRIAANPLDREHEEEIRLADAQSPNRRVLSGEREIARWVKLSPNLRGSQGFHIRQLAGQTPEALVLVDPFNVTGANLVRALAGIGERGGREVQFMLDGKGGNLFGRLTGKNLPDPATGIEQRLAVVLDGEILSAPSLESQIFANGRITGIQDPKEIDFIVDILNAGSLPAALNPNPLSEQSISPTLGQDTIRSGVFSMIVATALVVLFMIVYYHFAGLVACFVLALNLLLVVASMIACKAAFTLPGLAGLVLTVGMAVDSNVLIYERMREELLKGAGLRMAIRNGFHAATGTIVDANLTTLIVAVVLFAIGTDQIRGFAVTLIFGLILSMFTAVYVARLIFDVCERNRWLKNITMYRLLTTTNFDFVKAAPIFMAISAILLVVGIAAVFFRGKDILDNDFRSGTTVHALWKDPQDIANIRKAVEGEDGLPSANVYKVRADNREYKIDTSVADVGAVKLALTKIFGDQLQRNSAVCNDLRPVQPSGPAAGALPAITPSTSSLNAPGSNFDGPVGASDKLGNVMERPDLAPGNFNNAAKAILALAVPQQFPLPLFTVLQDASAAPASTEPAPAVTESAPAQPAGSEATQGAPAAVDAAQATAESPSSAEPGAAANSTPASPPADSSAPATSVQVQPAPSIGPSETGASETVPAESGPATATSPSAPPAADSSQPSGILPGSNAAVPGLNGASLDPYAKGSEGTIRLEYALNHASLSAEILTAATAANLPDAPFELSNPGYVAGSGSPFREWQFKTSLPLDQAKKLIETLNANVSKLPVFPTSSQVGANVAADTQVQAINALLISLIGIIIYVWFRFSQISWGVAGVVALVHDVLMMLGFIALSYYAAPYLGVLMIDPFKISLTIVAAFLTIVGYSINDTIVIFDRMREVKGKSPELTEKIINVSLNETLSRTIITSLTVFLVVVPLYIMGGQAIHGFAFALLVGVVFGSYSSLFIAAPLVLWMTGANKKKTA